MTAHLPPPPATLRLKPEAIAAAMNIVGVRSKEVLAVRLGVSRSTLFRALSGEEPSGRLIAALVVLGIDPDDVIEATAVATPAEIVA